MSGTGGNSADFWSRRKAAVREAEEADRAEAEAAQQAEMRQALEEKSDQEILEELGLPDPDTLEEKDDFSRFLGAAVPERLRRRALRRLWSLNPVLANLDGLVDYADDFTDAATVVSDLQTVYQVGKGMFDRFAGLEDTENTPEELATAEVGVSPEDDGNKLQCEENDASQKDFIQNGKTSFQLTQGDSVVQSTSESVESVEIQETALDEILEEPRIMRRRITFDYS